VEGSRAGVHKGSNDGADLFLSEFARRRLSKRRSAAEREGAGDRQRSMAAMITIMVAPRGWVELESGAS
jgi:hypothetical protein